MCRLFRLTTTTLVASPGKTLFSLNDTHSDAVSTLIGGDIDIIVSGGIDGILAEISVADEIPKHDEDGNVRRECRV